MTTDTTPIPVMEVARHRYEINDPFLFDILDPNLNREFSTNKLNGQFVHSQLFMNCLLKVSSTENAPEELVAALTQKMKYLTVKNKTDLLTFQKNYSRDEAIWWYTKEAPQLSFYLNKALREQDIDLIFSFRFFICDIRDQLSHLQYKESTTVYRAQQMQDYEFKRLQDSKKTLIAVNSFFATSINRNRTVDRLTLSEPVANNVKRILFEIHLDPAVVTTKPFADIKTFSDFEIEEEILIMLGSIFRLLDIRVGENEERNAWIIEMKLCGDEEHDLMDIINEIEVNNGESNDETSLLLFAHALRDMGKFDDANNYYELAREQLSPDNKKMISRCLHGLGNIADDKGKYDESLKLFEEALIILNQTSEPDIERQARIHISIGSTHWNNDHFDDAINSYNYALLLVESQSGNNTNYLKAMCSVNNAEAFLSKKDYSMALEWCKRAQDICQKYLSGNHDLLGGCYFIFGEIDRSTDQYQNALDNFHHALKIYYKSLTFDHIHVADVMSSMAKTYEKMGDLNQAYQFYCKSGDIYREYLVSTHRKVLENVESINRISSLLEQS